MIQSNINRVGMDPNTQQPIQPDAAHQPVGYSPVPPIIPNPDQPGLPVQPATTPAQTIPSPLRQPTPQVTPQATPNNVVVNDKTKPRVNPNSTQNALEIAEIRDGIAIMNDGSFRAVVMCKSINFDLMSPQEREGVELAYQGFLNSLYFPIQITVRSRKVDLRPYLEKLDKIKSEHDNMLLSLLMEDYIYFMTDLAEQTNIMDKMFYVTMPFYNTALDAGAVAKQTKGLLNIFRFNKTTEHIVVDESVLETAKTELRNRVQTVMQGLQQCGVKSLPLDTQELIELYYDSYNPDTATRQQLKNFEDISTPIVTKGQGNAANAALDRTMT